MQLRVTVLPDLIVGHGVVGRLLARLVIAAGGPSPVVWETNPPAWMVPRLRRPPPRFRQTQCGYHCICDASGDSKLLDTLVMRLAAGGEIVLAGFYADRLSFSFPMAFMREARFRIAAQWQPADLGDGPPTDRGWQSFTRRTDHSPHGCDGRAMQPTAPRLATPPA